MVRVFDQALAFLRAPDKLVSARQQALPADLTPLLRVAAGEADAIAVAVEQTGAAPALIREAAALFLQQMLFAADGDSYRVLGVNPDASDERIKEHHRWLVRWLHPDRNSDGWEAVYVNRVNAAWQDLRSPDRRRNFDRARGAGVDHPDLERSPATERHARRDDTRRAGPLLSSRAVRWLPMLVMVGLSVFALAGLLLLYTLQPPTSEPAVEAPDRAVSADEQSQWITGTSDAGTPPAVSVPVAGAGDVLAQSDDAAGVGEISVPDPMASLVATQRAVAEDVAPALQAEEGTKHQGVPAPAMALEASELAPAPESGTPSAIDSGIALASADTGSAATPLAVATPVASHAAPVIDPEPEPRAGLIDEDRAKALVGGFTRAYEAGDIVELTRLFTRDTERVRTSRNEMLREYRRLFRTSERRRIQVSGISWVARGATATIFASFDASILPHGWSAERQIRGDIRFDLRREDGELRIVELRHESHRG